MANQGNRAPSSTSSLVALSFAAGALFVVGGAVTLSFLASLAPRRPETEKRPEAEPQRFLLTEPSLN